MAVRGIGDGYAVALALGDLDGDGDLDLVVGNSGGNLGHSNYVYFNDGNGVFTFGSGVLPKISDSTESLALGDLDGDGDLDAVVANSGEEAETVWLNEGYSTYLPLVISNWP